MAYYPILVETYQPPLHFFSFLTSLLGSQMCHFQLQTRHWKVPSPSYCRSSPLAVFRVPALFQNGLHVTCAIKEKEKIEERVGSFRLQKKREKKKGQGSLFFLQRYQLGSKGRIDCFFLFFLFISCKSKEKHRERGLVIFQKKKGGKEFSGSLFTLPFFFVSAHW